MYSAANGKAKYEEGAIELAPGVAPEDAPVTPTTTTTKKGERGVQLAPGVAHEDPVSQMMMKKEVEEGIQLAPGVAQHEDAIPLGSRGDISGAAYHGRELGHEQVEVPIPQNPQGEDDDDDSSGPNQAIDAFVVQEDGAALTEEGRRQEALKRMTKGAPLVEGVAAVTEKDPEAKESKRYDQELEQRRRNRCLLIAFILILVLGAVFVPLAGLEKLPNDSKANGNADASGDDSSLTDLIIASSAPTTLEPSTNPTMTPSDYPSLSPSGVPSTMEPTTMAPTSSMFGQLATLLFANPEEDRPKNPASPQWKALKWLAEEDPLNNITLSFPERLSQRYALATFYFATNGERWTDQLNFLSGRHECEWFGPAFSGGGNRGAFCTGVNSTTPDMIALVNNNLAGTLPDELGLLTAMLRMDLQFNPDLTGKIPSTIGMMKNLRVLQIHNCNLNNEIPWSVLGGGSLLYLIARNNQFTGTLPSNLENVGNLVHLDVDNNFLSGSIPTSLFSSEALQALSVNLNLLDGSLPDIPPGSLELLGTLYLANNGLTGTIPESIGNMESLGILDLGSNSLTGSLPKSFTKLSNLAGLAFPANQLTGTLPFVNGSNPNMVIFIASRNNISGTLEPLGYLPKLQNINIEGGTSLGNSFTGSIPSSLCTLTDMVQLALSDNYLTGTIPECIGNLRKLFAFGVRNNQMGGTIPRTFQNLTLLNTLELSKNNFNGTFPGDWIERLSLLETLVFSENNFSGTLSESLSSLVNLKYLVGGANNFTGPLPELGNAPNLQIIDFGFNRLTGTVPESFLNLTMLDTMILNHNQITGDLTSLCEVIQFGGLTADCYNRSDYGVEIICPCCTLCCDESLATDCVVV